MFGNSQIGQDGANALFLAVQRGHLGVAQQLIEASGDQDKIQQAGTIALGAQTTTRP